MLMAMTATLWENEMYRKRTIEWPMHRSLHINHARSQVKPESEDADWASAFSPETSALLKGLGDSPESLELKASYMQSINQLKRGPHRL